MELIYKIGFNSTNFYFKRILDDLIIEANVQAKSKMYKGFILLLCDDTEDKIKNFFKILEEKLPLSIFLSNSEVLEAFDFDRHEELEDKGIQINLTLLTNDEIKNILDENQIDFSNDINKIKDGGISRFETHNGLKDLFLPSKKIRENFEKEGHEVKLLITNINKLENLVDVSQKDLQLLCSIERPLVKLKFKLLQNLKSEYSGTRFIYGKIADDRETVLFSQALKENDINYLLYVNDEIYQDGLKVTYNEDQNIIIHGEKGLFPKFDYQLNRQVNSSTDYFDEYGSIYKSILAQYNKRIVPSIGIYFSYKSDESAIKINVPSVGEKNVIYIPNIVNNIDNCLEDIKNIDENTQRLVANYKIKFEKNFEKNFTDTDSDGFASFLNLLSYIMGMKNYNYFENMALLYNGKSGIQIDMHVIKINDKNYLDYRKVIQSIMSYKMADVEDTLLAYSFYESLAEFINDNILKINSELNAKDLILCGDMFSNSILFSKIKKSQKGMKIFIPKEYPLDY